MVLDWYTGGMENSGSVFLEIDGGGTGCRATLVNQNGEVLGGGESGAANIMTRFSRAVGSAVVASSEALQSSGNEALLLPEAPVRFCKIGGLGPIYAEMLSNYYRSRVSEPLAAAADGVACLACKMFADQAVAK